MRDSQMFFMCLMMWLVLSLFSIRAYSQIAGMVMALLCFIAFLMSVRYEQRFRALGIELELMEEIKRRPKKK